MRDVRDAIQYHAARRCWPVRDQKTPGEGITWEQWFLRRFRRTLDEAAEDFAKDRA